MAAIPKARPIDEAHLVDNVNTYLKALADGLSADFAGESFEHLKLLGKIGVTSRLYDKVIKEYLDQFSIMPVEHQVLVTLRAKVASAPAELAEATQQTRAGMTSTLDRLEKRKLIKRVPHPSDRRKTNIKLTKNGDTLTSKLVNAQNQALGERMQYLKQNELNKLNQALDIMIEFMS